MSDTNRAEESQKAQDNEETKSHAFDFELHYGLYRKAGGVLWEILDNLSSHKHIHNWDQKILTTPQMALEKFVRKVWRENNLNLNQFLHNMLSHSSVVEETSTHAETLRGPLAAQEATEGAGIEFADTFLFFTKVRTCFNSCKGGANAISRGFLAKILFLQPRRLQILIRTIPERSQKGRVLVPWTFPKVESCK
jgi:hypothetical protein